MQNRCSYHQTHLVLIFIWLTEKMSLTLMMYSRAHICLTWCTVSRQSEKLAGAKKTGSGQLAGITAGSKWRRRIKSFVNFVMMYLPCNVHMSSTPTTSFLQLHQRLLIHLYRNSKLQQLAAVMMAACIFRSATDLISLLILFIFFS